jgi:tRNA-splicing endonuclease subunit Sen2
MGVDTESAQVPIQDTKLNDSATHPQGKATNRGTKGQRRQRPNFNVIHAKPLPIEIYPLPAFLPHNPISIVRIAVKLISHSLFVAKSHPIIHQAYFSPETQSVHVTDPVSIRALWEQGFWGKGSLSRSEPQWLAGEKKRRGFDESKTSAEVTQSRREERKQFKLERARVQREAIEQQLRQEGKLEAASILEELVEDKNVSEDEGALENKDDTISEIEPTVTDEKPSVKKSDIEASPKDIEDQEHLQLTPEEAFYLTYALGALNIANTNEKQLGSAPCPAWYFLRLYTAHAISPIRKDLALDLQILLHQKHPHRLHPVAPVIPAIDPNNAFMLRYVVYHHFRSLGWVVRPGIKFAVDYLLYLRGPAFHHAEFAIMIVPSYSDPCWSHTSQGQAREGLQKKDWWWLHRVNRVQTAVFKTLVLVYVEVPPPWDDVMTGDVDVGSVLKMYKVREVVIRRWSPNRNRD